MLPLARRSQIRGVFLGGLRRSLARNLRGRNSPHTWDELSFRDESTNNVMVWFRVFVFSWQIAPADLF